MKTIKELEADIMEEHGFNMYTNGSLRALKDVLGLMEAEVNNCAYGKLTKCKHCETLRDWIKRIEG